MIRLPFAALLALSACLLPLGSAAVRSAAPVAAPVETQGLVQLHLSGVAAAPSQPAEGPEGYHGHLVEIEVTALATNNSDADLVLHLHVARGTTGFELLQVVAGRLKRLGVMATLTGGLGEAQDGSLWIERAMRVHLRLGGGLIGEVACVEGPPAAIKLHPSAAIHGEATVQVAASTARVLPGRRPIRGLASFSASLAEGANSAEAATLLWKAATEAWVSDRPGTDGWRPIKMASGETITGVSVRLAGQADWGLEVTL